MARKANPKLVGAFVLGAIMLVVMGVAIFGSGNWFTKKHKVVMFFTGNVAGLGVGAPVNFRGVKVGQVVDILLIAAQENETIHLQIPVYAEIESGRVVRQAHVEPLPPREGIDLLVNRGMRAQLSQVSFVTGQLAVELNLHPDSAAKYVKGDLRYQEIPTIPSAFEQITKSIAELPIAELLASVQQVVTSIDKLVKSPEVGKTIKSAQVVLESFARLAVQLEKELSPMSAELRVVVGSARQALDQATTTLKAYDTLARSVTKEVGPLAKSVTAAMTSARSAIVEAEKTVKNIGGLMAQDSPLRYQLHTMAQELAAASRSIRLFSEYLERHPEALIRGKGGPGQR